VIFSPLKNAKPKNSRYEVNLQYFSGVEVEIEHEISTGISSYALCPAECTYTTLLQQDYSDLLYRSLVLIFR